MEQAATIESQLHYRLYQEGDEEGILRLWEKESGWGAITMQQFREWFLETPYGECILVVAANENNEVKAQVAYAPTRIVVNNRVIKSLRAAAPIVDSSIRQTNLRSPDHPVVNLIKRALIEVEKNGYQFVYSFPAYGWLPFMQLIGRMLPYENEIRSFECFNISLHSEVSSKVNPNYLVNMIPQFTIEHEQLWNDAIVHMPVHCAIARELPLINRLCGPAIKLETRNASDNSLIGYSSIRKDGLLYDIVARTITELKIVFEQTIATIQNLSSDNHLMAIDQIKGMLTKETEAILENIPYTKDSYHFAFGCWLLDNTLDFESFKTSRWYMTPLG